MLQCGIKRERENMTIHTPIKQQHREMFYKDLEEIGFTFAQIKEELALLKTCNEEIDYIKASRVGKSIALNRKERKAIYLSYDIWVA